MALERALEGSGEIFRDDEEKATFLRRLKRALKQPIHQASSEELLAGAIRIDTEQNDTFPFTVQKLMPLAEEGSVTAMGLLQSALYCVAGNDALTGGDLEVAASAFAEAYRKNSLVVRWEPTSMGAARSAMTSLYSDLSRSEKVRAEALFVHANLLFLHGDLKGGLKQLRMAQALLPQDGYFHAIEGCILAMQMKTRAALAAYQCTAELACDDIEHTLFHRAVLMSVIPGAFPADEIIPILEAFVEQAEPDAQKLPEACYRLSLLHGTKGPRTIGTAKRYFLAGQKADRARLPCFRDEADEWRKQAGALVKRYQSCGNPDCSEAGTKVCKACGQISYCSRACQLQHWKTHKKFCRTCHQEQQQQQEQG